MKPPTFNEEIVVSNYRRQFDAAAECNGYIKQEKPIALILATEILSNLSGNKRKLWRNLDMVVVTWRNFTRANGKLEYRIAESYSTILGWILEDSYLLANLKFVKSLSIKIGHLECQPALRLELYKELNKAVIHGLEFAAIGKDSY